MHRVCLHVICVVPCFEIYGQTRLLSTAQLQLTFQRTTMRLRNRFSHLVSISMCSACSFESSVVDVDESLHQAFQDAYPCMQASSSPKKFVLCNQGWWLHISSIGSIVRLGSGLEAVDPRTTTATQQRQISGTKQASVLVQQQTLLYQSLKLRNSTIKMPLC